MSGMVNPPYYFSVLSSIILPPSSVSFSLFPPPLHPQHHLPSLLSIIFPLPPPLHPQHHPPSSPSPPSSASSSLPSILPPLSLSLPQSADSSSLLGSLSDRISDRLRMAPSGLKAVVGESKPGAGVPEWGGGPSAPLSVWLSVCQTPPCVLRLCVCMMQQQPSPSLLAHSSLHPALCTRSPNPAPFKAGLYRCRASLQHQSSLLTPPLPITPSSFLSPSLLLS